MLAALRRLMSLPVAATVFAGLVGAGVVDGLVGVGHGGGASALVLAVGLYGGAALPLAALAGLLSGAVLAAIPGGWAGLRDDERRDRAATAGLLCATAGVGVLAIAAAAAHHLFVAGMANPLLATLASGGFVVMAAPLGAAVALAILPLARRGAARIPRRAPLGASGGTLLGLAAAGALAGVAALSRADWRAIDLGPVEALALAMGLGTAHGLFWYRSGAGRALATHLPRPVIRLAATATCVLCLARSATLPESAPVWRVASSTGLGLKLGIRLARRVADRDGDGYAALFGGGDCDDRRADVYPGADDIPGDGIDQNCEGGDAPLPLGEPTTPAPPGPAGSVAAPNGATGGKAGPFAGNLLVITIDALRADRLGVGGYRRAGKSVTPHLDALAARAAVWRRVWAQGPNTPRSFPSLLTSRWPDEVAWKKQSLNYSPLLPSNVTFFEGLAAAGLRPIGIFSHFYFTPDRGLGKSFLEWSNDGAGSIAESNKDSAAPRIVARVIERLRRAARSGEHFALWTHLFEPHSSYLAHHEFPGTPGLAGPAALMEKYDYEIAYVDLWIGKLLAALDETGLGKTTAVVVAADHGEAWGEHRAYFHGSDLYDEQMRVPLILAIPGRPAGVYDDPVALVDLGPTLLDLYGQPVPPGMRGRSLLPRLGGGPLPARPVYLELLPSTATPDHVVAMVESDHKLIHRVSDRRWELYDLAADPGEKRDLAGDPAARATFESLRGHLLDFEEKRRR